MYKKDFGLVHHTKSIVEAHGGSIEVKSKFGETMFFLPQKSLDVGMTKIRKMIQTDQNIELINVDGIGYKFIVTNNKKTANIKY